MMQTTLRNGGGNYKLYTKKVGLGSHILIIDVPYPLSTDDNCGDPSYKVYCNNGIVEFLSARGFYYKILSINPIPYKLIISPPPIQKGTCYSSDFSSEGLKPDKNLPFNISAHNTVMLFNCTEPLYYVALNCTSTSFCRQFEDNVEEGIGISAIGCTAYTSMVNMKPGSSFESRTYSIELQWVPPIEFGAKATKRYVVHLTHILSFTNMWGTHSMKLIL
uniref:Wall-associated receptor kinase galacturonan-binding domain-containing protein n=1 Tax=Quercus lobata TaxID=97700 RepID=A0A7N2L4Y2_QUELO